MPDLPADLPEFQRPSNMYPTYRVRVEARTSDDGPIESHTFAVIAQDAQRAVQAAKLVFKQRHPDGEVHKLWPTRLDTSLRTVINDRAFR